MSASGKKNQTQCIDGIKTIANIVLVGSALLCSGNALASTFTFGNLLANSDFESGVAGIAIPGWIGSGPGGGVNVRTATDVINVKTGNAGFSTSTTGTEGAGFFGSQFAVLGDAKLGIASGELKSGNFVLYQDFFLDSTYNNEAVTNYTLTFDFLSVFDGLDSLGFNGNDTINDVFFATLINVGNSSKILLNKVDSNGLTQTCLNNATLCPDTAALHQISGNTSKTISGVLPGHYRLQFKLHEIFTGTGTGEHSAEATKTNTAVGIDNVAVTGSVQTIAPSTGSAPEPGALVLMTLGLLGFRMRKSA